MSNVLSVDAKQRISEALRGKLRDSDKEVRVGASKYLCYLKEEREDMIDLYIYAITDGSQVSDREAAKTALIRLGEPAIEKVIDELVNNEADDAFATIVGMEILGGMALLSEQEEAKIENEKSKENSRTEESCPSC